VDLVALSEVRWGYFRTRKQFLFSRFPPEWRVFFAQPPAFGGDDPWRPRREGNVVTFTVPYLKPGTTSTLYNRLIESRAARSAIDRASGVFLRARLAGLGVATDPVIVTSNIYCPATLSRLPKKLVFYDFNDSPFQFSSAPSWAPEYWRRTSAQVDVFFVVSEFYRRRLVQETDRPVVVIGNGVETSHFEAPRPIPPDLDSLPRPRIGYVGLLSHFLDFETLEALRKARRGGSLVLIGPGSRATDESIRALASREGVHVLGPRPYADVPAYMQGLDVGVIPFRASDPFVQGINPNKVYQYLAAGIPVVTTPVLDLDADPPALQYATRGAEMVDAVARALDAPPDSQHCRALARPHDWSTLAKHMTEEIERRVAAIS